MPTSPTSNQAQTLVHTRHQLSIAHALASFPGPAKQKISRLCRHKVSLVWPTLLVTRHPPGMAESLILAWVSLRPGYSYRAPPANGPAYAKLFRLQPKADFRVTIKGRAKVLNTSVQHDSQTTPLAPKGRSNVARAHVVLQTTPFLAHPTNTTHCESPSLPPG